MGHEASSVVNTSTDDKHRSLRTSLGWPFRKSRPSLHENPKQGNSEENSLSKKENGSKADGAEVGAMKERFARLLLGDDMSGCGNGVSTALSISNAITNLCGSVFGQLWRRAPASLEEVYVIDWRLLASDHIVELAPSCPTSHDGTQLEAGPAEAGQEVVVACPSRGLNEKSRNKLNSTRDYTNQVKAAVAIIKIALSVMEVPDSYLQDLPKNARTVPGDFLYRFITLDPFSEDRLLDCLYLSSGDTALEIANRVEASIIYIWPLELIRSSPLEQPSQAEQKLCGPRSQKRASELFRPC